MREGKRKRKSKRKKKTSFVNFFVSERAIIDITSPVKRTDRGKYKKKEKWRDKGNWRIRNQLF